MPVTNCRHFNGYKPCQFSENKCTSSCSEKDIPSQRILIVHLEALGAVLRATSILPAIKRKFRSSHITWVTQSPAQNLLLNNPLIDKIYTTNSNDQLELRNLKFDYTYCIDKSLKATGVCQLVLPGAIYGFKATADGAIVPASAAADELWQLGLSNHKKFNINKKTETQLMIEALELGAYAKDEYTLSLTAEELNLGQQRRRQWAQHGQTLIGLNTGCSPTIPYKKLSINSHRTLIDKLSRLSKVSLVLLGGPEDTERNSLIANQLKVNCSPTELGLRDGMSSVSACDIVISGDSLGMHMAIALKKETVTWFGPTCSHEIEFYNRGEVILSNAECGPCWKRTCDKKIMCYDLVDLDQIVSAVKRLISLRAEPNILASPKL